MTCPATYRLWLVAIFSCISVANQIHGQGCGVLTTETAPEDFFKTGVLSTRTDVTDTVGLAVWVIRDTLPVAALYDQLETSLEWVNEKFKPAGLHFSICEWHLENGRGSMTRSELDLYNKDRFQDHRINLYLVQQLTINGLLYGGFGYFPWLGSREDRYVAVYQEGVIYPELIAHEFGHYYGLYHTHERMEGRELVLRSNCHIAGDLCCDTPADPGLGYHNMDECQYIGNERDQHGYVYTPLTDYIMSYAPIKCVDRFSGEQYNRMQMSRETVYPLMAGHCQDLPDITLETGITSPVIDFLDTLTIPFTLHHSLTRETEIDVTLYWNSSAGEIIHSDTMVLRPGTHTSNHKMHIILPPGTSDAVRTMRLKADGNRQVIEADERNNEATIAVTIDNSRFSDAMLFPNPAEDEVTLFFRRPIAQDEILMRMTNATGQSLGDAITLPMLSPYYTRLAVDHLAPGMYFLFFVTGKDVVEVVPFVKM